MSDNLNNLPDSALSGKKILWVEDDAFLSEIISRRLSKQNYVLIHTKDGETALSMVEKEKPDIILLDILLPGINGFDLLEKFKTNPTTKDIPVVLISNLSQQSDIERGLSLGAERFLVKATVSLDEITAQIKEVLEKFKK